MFSWASSQRPRWEIKNQEMRRIKIQNTEAELFAAHGDAGKMPALPVCPDAPPAAFPT